MARREYPLLSAAEINRGSGPRSAGSSSWSARCIGTDAHTVGIDAILNVKGHAGEKGLEYYREMRVVNLGAQVPWPSWSPGPGAKARTRCWSARSSPSVTHTLAAPARWPPAFRGHGGRRPLLVVGGPRFDPAMAADLGVDRIFGGGPRPARWPATWSMP